jgi:hypothetical protein
MTVRYGVSVRILRGLVGSTDSVTAFNDWDEVVGIRLTSPTRAFLWTALTGIHLLPTRSGWNSEAFAVNGLGTVVGDASRRPKQVPVEWVAGIVPVRMQVLFPQDSIPGGPHPGCVVRGINREGLMTGFCIDPAAGTWWVAEWKPLGAVRSICGALDCPLAGFGYAINSRGVIAGGPALDYFPLNAFIVIPTNTVDTLTKLSPLGPSSFGGDIAFAINDRSIPAGYGSLPGGLTCHDPVVWLNITMTPLDIGGGNCGQANGIDNRDDIVGTVQAPGDRAFIWDQAHGIQALPGLGGAAETSTAIAINDEGEVLGTVTSSGTKYDVIWTF